MAAPDMIDWNLAVATARRLVRPGPAVSYVEAAEVVAELRDLVPKAQQHVELFTQLKPPATAAAGLGPRFAEEDGDGAPSGQTSTAAAGLGPRFAEEDGDGAPSGITNIVDRVGWVEANVAGFQVALAPLLERLAARRGGAAPAGVVKAVGSRVTGMQVGAIMAYLASRVLGQYELFLPPGEGSGRLTLVAPNIVEVQRKLGVDPHDFRMWVALHESTHRTQFTAVPWMRDHFTAEVRAFLDASDLDPAALRDRLRAVSGAVVEALRGRQAPDAPSVIELIQTPEQRIVLARLQALMSLVEGHGDYVMDNVGPAVVPSAAEIRERFDARRGGQGPVDRLIRKLFGLDLKMRQYAEGARFVRHVVGAVGMAGFNEVWREPATLPTAAEIADPAMWIARVGATAQAADAGGTG